MVLMPTPIILGPTDLLWQVYHGPASNLDSPSWSGHMLMAISIPTSITFRENLVFIATGAR